MNVAIVGPESCGKTSLASALAAEFGVPWLDETARTFLTGRADYDEADLEQIAREQFRREQELSAGSSAPFCIYDTDVAVIWIWWHERFGRVPAWVDARFEEQESRHYLLLRPDIPWQPDPLRESPADRDRLFERYRRLLESRGASFDEVGGLGPARFRSASASIRRVNSI